MHANVDHESQLSVSLGYYPRAITGTSYPLYDIVYTRYMYGKVVFWINSVRKNSSYLLCCS